jgi:tight adherence protein C
LLDWLDSILRPKYAQLFFKEEQITIKMQHWKTLLVSLLCLLLVLVLCYVFVHAWRDVWLGLGFLCTLLPIVLIRLVSLRANKVKQQIVLDLPLWINRLLIRLAAGDTLYNAMLYLSEREEKKNRVLNQLLDSIIPQLRNNRSMEYVMGELNRRTRMVEVSQLTTILLLHSRKGGDELSISLRDLGRRLWEQRKHEMLRRGEQLSVKLVVPMVILFVDVMVVIATPAFLAAKWIA